MTRAKRNRYIRNVNRNRPNAKIQEDQIETYREIWNNGVRKLDSYGRPALAHVGYKTIITKTKVGTFYKSKSEVQALMQKKKSGLLGRIF